MSAPTWVSDAVFYQIFPERFANGDSSNDPPHPANWNEDMPTRENFFGGDLAGILAHADHLTRLGVNALYTTPIFKAETSHKYDTTDYRQIDPAFGTLETFKSLLHGLHDRGIRWILDGVFNHCGDRFPAFKDAVEKGRSSPYWDWFFIDDSLPFQTDPPSYQTCGGAAFLPKLNTSNPEVQHHVLDTIAYWLEQGADGWRLDVPWKVDMRLWTKVRERALSLNPDAYIVGEVWRGTADWIRGDNVHGVMNYRLRAHILDYALFDHLDAEDFVYEVAYLLREHGETAPYHLTLLGSHDTPRLLTLARGNIARTRIAITLQLTLPGAPMIYYGDEIGMEGENDPDCRRPMIWDERRWNQPIWETTCTLIALRHAHPALRSLHVEPIKTWDRVLVFARREQEDIVIVVANTSIARADFRFPIPPEYSTFTWREVFSGKHMTVEQGCLSLRPLPAQSVFVFVPERDPQP